MQYRYDEQGNENRSWKDRRKHSWSCLNQKGFMEQTKGKAVIFADAGVKGKATDDMLTDGKHSLPLYLTRQKPGFFQKIEGYIPCADDQQKGYVRVIGTAAGRIIALLLLLAALIAGGVYLWLTNQEEGPNLDREAVAYEMPAGMVNDDPNQIALPGYSVLTVSNSDNIVHMPLINPEGNVCYFVYTISLADTGEVLYESGYIKPGTGVPEFELNQTLEPGTYDIKVDVATWSVEDYTQPLNGGSIEAELKVEE